MTNERRERVERAALALLCARNVRLGEHFEMGLFYGRMEEVYQEANWFVDTFDKLVNPV